MPLRVPRPASSSPPARWRAFVRRPSGRLASTRHTSATEARRSLAASFTSFGCGSAMSAVCAFACHRPSIHHLRPSATVAAWHPGPAAPFRGKASSRRRFARLHPRLVNGGDAAAFLPPHRQPAAARIARDSLCLPQVVPCRIRRGYCRSTLLPCPSASTGPATPSRITPRFLSSPSHCHEQQPPPVRRPVSVAAGGNPPGKRFLPIRWPIR